MKFSSAGFRHIVLISVWTVIFAAGCGVNIIQTDTADTINFSQDVNVSDAGDSGDDVLTESLPIHITDSESDFSGEESETTSTGQEELLVTDTDTLQAVLDIVENSADQTVLEYADFTSEEFLEEVASVYQIAHDNGYVYGDSQTTPPCEDGIISCDRLIARALWNLGMNDQPDKGMNVGKEPWYLTTHGFEIVTDQSQLQSGDIVLQDNGISGIPNWQWHTFVLVSYDPETTMCEKYDCGHFTPEGEDRISSEQPFTCPLADYGSQRRFVCGFHLKHRPTESEP